MVTAASPASAALQVTMAAPGPGRCGCGARGDVGCGGQRTEQELVSRAWALLPGAAAPLVRTLPSPRSGWGCGGRRGAEGLAPAAGVERPHGVDRSSLSPRSRPEP